MPGRSFSTPSYRYGFNGKEKDDEVKGTGNSIDFGARIYDPRLGRLLSLDPLSKKFPSESNYSYAGNSPLLFIDEEGKKKTVYLTIITKDGKKVSIKLVNEKDTRIAMAASFSETVGSVQIKNIEQSVVIDLSKGTTTISDEKVVGTYSMKLSQYASNTLEYIDNAIGGDGGTQSGGFRLVSLNGENAGDDPTKMKIDPKTAGDLKTLNFDDIAAAMTAVGTKGKDLFNDISSGVEVISDIVNNAKEMTEAAQDMDPNSQYQLNSQKSIPSKFTCTNCPGDTFSLDPANSDKKNGMNSPSNHTGKIDTIYEKK